MPYSADGSGHADHTTLFDRFETDEDRGLDSLAFDLADILSGRRAFAARGLGVLNWGMPSMMNITSKSVKDRQVVAGHIADTIERFEPRLEGVKVIPVEDAADFAFRIEAQLVESESTSLTLRVLSPLVGGGLGAKVLVVDVRKDANQ